MGFKQNSMNWKVKVKFPLKMGGEVDIFLLDPFKPIWTHLDPFGPTGPIKITLGNAVGDTFGSVLEKQL